MWIKTEYGTLVNTDHLNKIEPAPLGIIGYNPVGDSVLLASSDVDCDYIMDRIYYHLSVGDNIMTIPKEGEE